jgi:hypothetical protein
VFVLTSQKRAIMTLTHAFVLIFHNLSRGDFPCRHGEAALYLVSLVLYAGISRATLAAQPYHQ